MFGDLNGHLFFSEFIERLVQLLSFPEDFCLAAFRKPGCAIQRTKCFLYIKLVQRRLQKLSADRVQVHLFIVQILSAALSRSIVRVSLAYSGH